jgi:hypothetical protein
MKGIFNEAAGKGLTDDQLLDAVQRQTLRYFWDFAHPNSGMARERSNVVKSYGYDLDCVTSGGTGFGIMAIVAGTERGWIDRGEARAQLEKIVGFLEAADKFHGVFPHFLNGNTGKTIPFSPKDDGGDLVETSFLMMGLLSAREYFVEDPALQARITKIWEEVEWDHHVQGGKLLWHWSPNHGYAMNLPIEGWNECLITHVLAAASPTHPVPMTVYKDSWQKGVDFINGGECNGAKPDDTITQPLGPLHGGPLFFAHYSFMGLNPKQLKDEYADYFAQNRAHTLINRAHCINNPLGYAGYGEDCWGLTAGDTIGGYAAHSPTDDRGVISPTAALSSFPYTPKESMQVLRHFYEDLGDKIWTEYGFVDAFSEAANWHSKSHLAIDQGPIIVMIENHRSGLLWDLFMNAPGVKPTLEKLGLHSATKQAAAVPKPPKAA